MHPKRWVPVVVAGLVVAGVALSQGVPSFGQSISDTSSCGTVSTNGTICTTAQTKAGSLTLKDTFAALDGGAVTGRFRADDISINDSSALSLTGDGGFKFNGNGEVGHFGADAGANIQGAVAVGGMTTMWGTFAGMDGGDVTGMFNASEAQARGNLGVDGGLIVKGAITSAAAATVAGITLTASSGFSAGGDFYWQGGKAIQGSGTVAFITLSSANSTKLNSFRSSDNAEQAYSTTDGGTYYDRDNLGAIVSHNGGSQACEHGSDAGVAGAMTYAFQSAFSVAPDCTCTDTAGVAGVPVACSIGTTSTTVVTANAVGTDLVRVICCGKQR